MALSDILNHWVHRVMDFLLKSVRIVCLVEKGSALSTPAKIEDDADSFGQFGTFLQKCPH
jgi:hypothetical protein